VWPPSNLWAPLVLNKKNLYDNFEKELQNIVSLATCTSSMDAINVCLGLFSVHYQLKIYFKADFSSSESHYLPKTLLKT
jgi:hypothetical protein